ncbi:thioether cross-link-forming SCIFF peptide maturase [Clostridium sp. DL1XJH146]
MALIHKFELDNEYFVIDVNSGTVHVIDELVYDILDDDKFATLNEIKEKLKSKYEETEIIEAYNEIKELVDDEYLYTMDLYEHIAKDYEESPNYIKALCLNVTHDCNLRCKYCFADEGKYHGVRKVMSAEVGKKAINYVIKHSGPRKNIEIDLFGGEPLLAMDEIKEIIHYARGIEKESGKNIRFTMTTNCTLLNDELIEYLNKEMVNIVLSIDGRKEVNDAVRFNADHKGTHDIILPKIKKMVEHRDNDKAHYVRGTFTRDNLDFYKDIIYLADQGFKEISVEPVVLPDESNLSLREVDLEEIFENYEMLYREMLKRRENGQGFNFYHFNIDLQGGPCVYKRISGCGAGHEYISVTPDGDIYPCHQFVGNKDFLMGNIYDDNTFNDELVSEFKKAHLYSKPECRNCWARFYCSGGCQANNYNFNGDMKVPYKIGCELLKKRTECAIALKSKQSKE